MATSLGQLLDTLAATARTTPGDPASRADAGIALGHLGRALHLLRVDGVSAAVADAREQQVAALAAACVELGARAPTTEARFAQLAAAAADTVGILREQFTVASRWATATALAETATPLGDVIAAGLSAGPAAELLIEIQAQAVLVQQTAALTPPNRADAALLDRPVPGWSTTGAFDPAAAVPDAVAVLVQATAQPPEPVSIAEVLAYTLAAQTLSSAAAHLHPAGRPEPGAGQAAADAWRAVRVVLRPFHDGSRHRHPHAPAAVQAAGRLHTTLSRDIPEPAAWSQALRSAVAAGAQHLPTLAAHLDRIVRSSAETGALLAYAVDLPPREDRVSEHLRGHRRGGLIRADALDLGPVTGALHNAGLLSAAVAARAADPGVRAASDFPRRAWAAHQVLLQHPQTPAALDAAEHQTYLRMQAPRGQSRPR